jgi:chromosome segregation ATPase
MRSSPSLRHLCLLPNLGQPFLWAMLVCVPALNVSAVYSKEPARIRGESWQANQDKTDCDQVRKMAQQLTAEVEPLKKKVAELDKYRQVDYLRDLLVKEEQRAEALQAQLLDISEKEDPLQSRIDQLDEQLRPENIDQALAGVGSTRPEDAKDALRRRLNNDKRRQQTQLDLLHQNRTRIQAALAGADASIQRLRLRLSEATHL